MSVAIPCFKPWDWVQFYVLLQTGYLISKRCLLNLHVLNSRALTECVNMLTQMDECNLLRIYYGFRSQIIATMITRIRSIAIITSTAHPPVAIAQPISSTDDCGIEVITTSFYRGYYDVETGLYYLQSRHYNPEIGRFINADAFSCFYGWSTIASAVPATASTAAAIKDP